MIPSSLQKRAIQLAHESHQGLAKTKALLRQKIWFPNIDNIVKDTVDKCITCQAIGQANAPDNDLHDNDIHDNDVHDNDIHDNDVHDNDIHDNSVLGTS